MTCPDGGRDGLLRRLEAAAREAGDALSELDRLGTGRERLASVDARLRALLEALPAADRAAVAPLIARGAQSAWSDIVDLTRALLSR